jgi:hypothetical protein
MMTIALLSSCSIFAITFPRLRCGPADAQRLPPW